MVKKPTASSITPTTLSTTHTLFSPSSTHYAHLLLAPDAQTLRVFDVGSSKCVLRWASAAGEGEGVGGFCWGWKGVAGVKEKEEEEEGKRGKKRRLEGETEEQVKGEQGLKEVVVVGLENGSLVVLGLEGGPPTTISSPSSTTKITSLSAPSSSSSHVYSAHEDGTIRLWDLTTSSLLTKILIPDATSAWDSIDISYPTVTTTSKPLIKLALLKSTLQIYSLKLSLKKSSQIASRVRQAVGHIGEGKVRFLSGGGVVTWAKGERFVLIWDESEGKLVKRLGLEEGVKDVLVSGETIAALSVEGKVVLADIGEEVENGGLVKILLGAGKGCEGIALRKEGRSLVVVKGNVKPVFEEINFITPDGLWLPSIESSLPTSSNGILNTISSTTSSAPLPTRYVEPLTSTVTLPTTLPTHTTEIDENDLDVDLAELTLAQRLRASEVAASKLKRKEKVVLSDEEEEEEEVSSEDNDDEDESDEEPASKIPTTTLASSLIQALHSSDQPLLDSCLAHSSPTLIRETVKRVPSGGLVITLLEKLVERFGGRGRGGKGTTEWIRQTLVVHVGFLITVPSLVTRLSTLHSTLSQRLQLQPTLLALNGRLELVVSQIELGRERNKKKVVVSGGGEVKKLSAVGGKKYVEGYSDDEEEGSVEDVVLGSAGEGSSSEKEEESGDDVEEEEDDELDEDDEDEDEPTTNGASAFLELEASEDEEEEEESDEEESD